MINAFVRPLEPFSVRSTKSRTDLSRGLLIDSASELEFDFIPIDTHGHLDKRSLNKIQTKAKLSKNDMIC